MAHRTTLQIYRSMVLSDIQIEALRVGSGRVDTSPCLVPLDTHRQHIHAAAFSKSTGLASAVYNVRSKGILLSIRWWRISRT
jgi:hypothetical protein